MKAAKECGADAVKTQKEIIKLYILNLFLMKNMIIQYFGSTYGDIRKVE